MPQPEERAYSLTIVCPRPPRTTHDEWHIQPARITTTLAHFFADAELTLTPRTVRLHTRWTGQLRDLDERKRRMATVMSCLRFDVPSDHHGDLLPLPVRIELRETTTPAPAEEPTP